MTLLGLQRQFSVHRDKASICRALECLRQSRYASALLHSGRRSLSSSSDRRAYERFCLQLPISVTPVAFAGERIEVGHDAEPICGTTRTLTLRGVGFTHGKLLRGDYAVVDFDLQRQGMISVLLEIRWSNHRQGFSYLSGGRFAAVVMVRQGVSLPADSRTS